MNEFATSSEPGGSTRPAPGAPTPASEGGNAARAYRTALRFARGIAGLDAYDRYVAHRSAHHPDEPLLDEAAFWRCKWESEEKNPKSRCC